jgi:predicted RNase H-like HicB family nuclease
MKTYQFRVLFESDGDGWFVSCPALEEHHGGALTWGQTREEAYEDIVKVLEIVLGSMIESGLPIPEEPADAALIDADQVFATVRPKLKPVPKKPHPKKTYRFRVELEPDEDGWFVRCPTLERYGAATWGETKEKAHKYIEEVLGMVLESMIELGIPIPEEPEDTLMAEDEGLAVTI